MASSETKLNRAIALARRGDRVAARQLLQQVVLEDRSNESAWLWLASTSDSLETKRKCLERVLKLNPKNEVAREGLARIRDGGQAGASAPSRAQTTQNNDFGATVRDNLITIGILLAVVGAVALLVFIIRDAIRPDPTTDEATSAAVAVVDATETPADGGQQSGRTPTAASNVTAPAVFVTANAATLPPTFTPTNTATPTATYTPEPTQIPLEVYQLMYSSLGAGESLPTLYRIRADGLLEESLEQQARVYSIRPIGGDVIYAAPTGDGAVTVLRGRPSTLDQTVPLVDGFSLSSISSLSWSPDGASVAFTGEDGSVLGVINVERGIVRELLVDEADKRGVTWSPDGAQIAFSSDVNSPGFTEIYKVEVASGDVEQLTEDIGSSYSPAWSPDGAQIAFISDRGGDGDLYVMDADGSDVRLVTAGDGTAEDTSPAWTLDGRWIGFASNRENNVFQIYLTNLRGTVVQVTSGARNNRVPAFFP